MNDRFNSGHPGTLMPPWPKGVSGNPGGRPKLARPPSAALAELNDTPGDSIPEIVENFKAARRKAGGLVAADHKALAMFMAESDVERRSQVSAFDAVTDRIEGKVPQALAVKSEASLVINIVSRSAMLKGLVAPDEAELRRKALQEATRDVEIVDGTSGDPPSDDAPDEEK